MGLEQLEQIGKKIGDFATSTAKKAGDQVQIAKLALDKAGLEKDIDGVYAAIGRYCYTKVKAGESMPAELNDYCADIDALFRQVAAIEDEIAAYKSGRDDVVYAEATETVEPPEEAARSEPPAGEVPAK